MTEAPFTSSDPGLPGDEFTEAEPADTKWPKVLGTIAIVYAIGGLLCQVMTLVWTFMAEMLMKMGGIDVVLPMHLKVTTGVMSIVITALGFLLLAGGIALVRRRRAGIARLKRWSVLRLIMLVLGVAVGIFFLMPAQLDVQRQAQEAANQQAREGGRPEFVKEWDQNAAWAQAVIMTGVISGVTAVFPLFVGFYLSRAKIVEEVARWD